MKISTPILIALGVVGVAALVVAGKGAKATGEAIGGAVVDMADGALSGVVLGVGDLVGVPRTDETECERAKREGRTWDASFACPAGNFISYVFS